MKKTTNEKETVDQLRQKIEADKNERKAAFTKELESLQKKYNCNIICQRVERGIAGKLSVNYSLIVEAI